MGKRFSRYAFALKAIKVGTSDAPATADTDSPLGKYQKWRKGDVTLEYPRADESLQKAMIPVAIRPFGLPFNDTTFARVTISKRTSDNSTANDVEAKCNIVTDATKIPDNKMIGFLPARATVRKLVAGDGTAETSKITGVKYKKKTSASYTLPYGQKTAATTESEIRKDIFEVVKGDATLKVSFTSEKL
jgi:hypothetical protein